MVSPVVNAPAVLDVTMLQDLPAGLQASSAPDYGSHEPVLWHVHTRPAAVA